MRKVPNTHLRSGVYYFRRVIPIEVQSRLRRAELNRSLRTSDAIVARKRSLRLYLFSEELFMLARSEPMLNQSDLARLVQDFYKTVLAREDQLRFLGRMSLDEEQRRSRVEHYAQVADQARKDLATNCFESADFIAAAMIKKHGHSGKLNDLEIRQVQQAMLRAGCDLADAMKARFEGDFNYEPRDALLKVELDKALADPAPVAQGAAPDTSNADRAGP